MERFAVILAAGLSLLLSWGLGYVIVPLLRKIKFGQTINEIGPRWHAAKQGTPTMGGFLFIIGSTIGLLAAYPLLRFALQDALLQDLGLLVLAVFTTFAFSAVGFIDDYLKVVRKQNLGLRAMAKTAMQAIIAVGFLVTLHMMGRLSTIVTLPFLGAIDFGILYYPIAFFLIIGMVNAVNLTDGIDGLCGSVSFWVMCGYFVLLTMMHRYELSLWAAALAGGCVGYLYWNFYPAKVFMGDTGSMYLGGAVVVLGFCTGAPGLILIFGFVYLVEAVSVMIQVTYFKLTKGKRLFKMTPIHHHFELSGWSEVKIDAVFSGVSLLCAALGCLYGVFVL